MAEIIFLKELDIPSLRTLDRVDYAAIAVGQISADSLHQDTKTGFGGA